MVRRTMVAPVTGGNEMTLVCDYPKPDAWRREADEARANLEKRWDPDAESFMAVAETPKTRKGQPATEVIKIRTLGDLVSAVLGVSVEDLARPGNYDIVPTRPEESIRRLNIIGHGMDSLVGLSGTIEPGAGRPNVWFDPELAESVYGTARIEGGTRTGKWRHGGYNENKQFLQFRRAVLDSGRLGGVAIDWLMGPLVDAHGNPAPLERAVDGSAGYAGRPLGETDPDHYEGDERREVETLYEGVRRFGRFVRDLMRTRFHPLGEVALITCKTGSISTFAHDLSIVFNTTVVAFREEVGYELKNSGERVTQRGLTKYPAENAQAESQMPLSSNDAVWEQEADVPTREQASPVERNYHLGYLVHDVTKPRVPRELQGLHLQFDRLVPKPTALGPLTNMHIDATKLRVKVLRGPGGVFDVEVDAVDPHGNLPTIYDEDAKLEVVQGGEYSAETKRGVEFLDPPSWRYGAAERGQHTVQLRVHDIGAFQIRATSGVLTEGVSELITVKNDTLQSVRFHVTLAPPKIGFRGESFQIRLQAEDPRDGTPKTDFVGAVVVKVARVGNRVRHFVPRLEHRFTEADRGAHVFTAKLRMQGKYRIHVLGEGLENAGQRTFEMAIRRKE